MTTRELPLLMLLGFFGATACSEGSSSIDLSAPDLSETTTDLAIADDLATGDLTPPAPVLTAMDTSYDYGPWVVGAPLTHTFTFTNTGTASTALLGVTVMSGPAFAIGDVANDHCETVLAPGDSCTVDVVFRAQGAGMVSMGSISLAGGGLSASTSLTGTGATSTNDLTVTTKEIAGGTGTIGTSPPGVDCGAGCFRFPTDAAVTVKAAPAAGSAVGQWNQDCSTAANGALTCMVTMSADRQTQVSFRPTTNFMFVTSTGIKPGTLGANLAGADTFCAQRASAGQLGGTVYKAWIATSTINALTRVSGSGGWIRVDGRPFAHDATSLGAGKVYYPPRITELDTDVPSAMPMTNADGNGAVLAGGAQTCSDYTDTAGTGTMTGLAHAGTKSWTYSSLSSGTCDIEMPIYCFELDYNDTPSPPPPPAGARYMFVTNTDLSAAAGVGAFDAQCASEASGKLPGTYVALVSTTLAAASSRVSFAGGNWYRQDNVQITATPADLGPGTVLAGPNVSASGVYRWPANSWTGATAPNQVGASSAKTCIDWTSNLSSDTGTSGTAPFSSSKWFSNVTYGCNYPFPVICVQQ